jgi:hypothetical protein
MSVRAALVFCLAFHLANAAPDTVTGALHWHGFDGTGTKCLALPGGDTTYGNKFWIW